MDIGIILAVGLFLLVAVLIRSAMTLADISHTLEIIADRRRSPRPTAEAAVMSAAQGAKDAKAERNEPDDAEIAAVIAIARATMDGALPIAR